MGDSIRITNEMLISKGIPEALLMALGMHILTGTKVEWRKYIIMSLIMFLMAAALRTLPISSGINTVLSLFGVFLTFQLLYSPGIQKMIRTIIAPIIILIFISLAEMLNLLLLSMIFGFETASDMMRIQSGWAQCLYAAPSTVILGLLLLVTHFAMKTIRKKRDEGNGSTGEETRP